jgi:hypothetical protein
MIWVDSRIGGFPRWYLDRPKGAALRIDSMLLDSVVYLAVKNDETDAPTLGGTACVVSVPSQVPGGSYQILVTAGHCVESMEQFAHRYLRVNRQDGTAQLIEITGAPWKFADDYPATDLAAAPLNLPPKIFKQTLLPVAMLATPQVVEEEEIGVGDELYVVGLFTKRHGKSKNIPIVRTGIISAMPDEPIDDPLTGVPYHAYLAELRSIGGLSGSPVFVELGPGRVAGDEVQGLEERTFYLLGLIRGHWPKKEYEVADFAVDTDEQHMLNTGIAAVTPIGKLSDIVYCEEWVRVRKENDDKQMKEKAATPDSSIPSDSHDAEFESIDALASGARPGAEVRD